MRLFLACICWCSLSLSCSSPIQPLATTEIADTLFSQYEKAVTGKNLDKELFFWKKRINPLVPDLVNPVRYANLLAAKFQATGNIEWLVQSDSILMKTAREFRYKDAGPFPGMIRNAITRHEFSRADSLLHVATAIGLRRYEAAAFNFDVYFELGQITAAKLALQQIAVENDYGYQFRKAKLQHYLGDVDSAIASMEAAVRLAGEDLMLWKSARSNLADLQLHAGLAQQAFEGYRQCLLRDPSDLHCILGIGWIALMHDGNDVLAARIFQWAETKTGLPDPYLKQIAVAEYRNDSAVLRAVASRFVEKATAPAYGGMYHKYLIPVCADILGQQDAAIQMAKRELLNRNTPQANAWFAYALLQNGKKEAAMKVYKERISGQPLEGLEQFYMARLTHALGNQFTANKYTQYSLENKYDLTPRMIRILDTLGTD